MRHERALGGLTVQLASNFWIKWAEVALEANTRELHRTLLSEVIVTVREPEHLAVLESLGHSAHIHPRALTSTTERRTLGAKGHALS